MARPCSGTQNADVGTLANLPPRRCLPGFVLLLQELALLRGEDPLRLAARLVLRPRLLLLVTPVSLPKRHLIVATPTGRLRI